MIRKQITFILLLISCFIAAVHSADDTSRAELVIKAYKPTAADDLQNDGGFKFVIIDALANSDDSSLNEINENRNEIDISNYLHHIVFI